MKYITIFFSGAKCFLNNKKSSSYTNTSKTSKIQRPILNEFKEPINKYIIANMISVMFGDRPIPSIRDSFFIKSKSLFYENLAQKSYLKILNPKIKNRDGIDEYISEMFLAKKTVNNAYSRNSDVSWFRIKKHLGDTNFNLFQNLICQLGFDIKTPFNELKLIMRDNINTQQKVILQNFLKDKKALAIFSAIMGDKNGKENSDINKLKNTLKIVPFLPEKIIKLRGYIIVPMEDDIFEMFKHSSGVSTILDGGIAEVISVTTEASDFNLDDYISVANIDSGIK